MLHEVARYAVQKIGLRGVEVVQVVLERVQRHVGPSCVRKSGTQCSWLCRYMTVGFLPMADTPRV